MINIIKNNADPTVGVMMSVRPTDKTKIDVYRTYDNPDRYEESEYYICTIDIVNETIRDHFDFREVAFGQEHLLTEWTREVLSEIGW